jgi:hypothetical protein
MSTVRYQSGIRPALDSSLPFFLDTEFRKIEQALKGLPSGGSGGDVDGGGPDSLYLPTQVYDGGAP